MRVVCAIGQRGGPELKSILSGEMIKDTVKILNEAIKDKIRVNLLSTTAPAATPP